MPTLSSDDIARFQTDGALLVRGAVPREAVAPMRELIWSRLREIGMREDDPTSWRSANSKQMSGIKRHAAFAAMDSPRLHAAIDELIGAGSWTVPDNWGMFRITAPAPGLPWQPTAHGWHSDCLPWDDQRHALFVLSHLGETVPGGGGTLLLAGSHRRLAAISRRQPPQQWSRKRLRTAFHQGSPWLSALMGLAPCDRPRSRFMSEPSPADEHGVRLRVIEAAGEPGDVWLCHPTIYHAVNDNRSQRMRMMRLRTLSLDLGRGRDDPASTTALALSVRESPSPATQPAPA